MKCAHVSHDVLAQVILHYTDKCFGIFLVDNLGILDLVNQNKIVLWARARRDNDCTRLLPLFDCMKDNILLKHVIITKTLLTRVIHMDAVQRHSFKKALPKVLKVPAIAEASRCNRDQLSTINKDLCCNAR